MLSNYIFITVQPYDFYFSWQVETQIVNFRKHGISDRMHVLIWYPEEKVGTNAPLWEKIEEKYPEVKFFYYTDSGGTDVHLYISMLRPDALMQHFAKYPELRGKTIFYHDCDIIFNYLPDFDRLATDDINWQSNTSSYLDYDYLRRKEQQGKIPEHEAIQVLADIGKVSVDTIKSYTGKTGGAQYVLKGIDSDFWKDVKQQCYGIRDKFYRGSDIHPRKNTINYKYFSSEAEGFQSWCADMWAVNFALWNRGKITDITPELDFSWATDSEETYLKKPIYHNAGANGKQPGIFYKGKWILTSPVGKIIIVKQDSASKYYIQAIKEVQK